MRRFLVLAASGWVALGLGGCRGCGGSVKNVSPVIGVTPVAIDFGKVKVASTQEQTLEISALSNAPLSIETIVVEGPGAAAFEVVGAPSEVPELSQETLTVRFSPSALAAYEASLVITSNDEEHPRLTVPLLGEGAKPVMVVTPECSAARKCTGSATVDPPALDFGAEPFARLLPIEVTALPSISVVNEGEVPLVVSQLAIEGADAAAFTFAGNSTLPAGGLVLEAGTGVNLAIRFKPTSESQAAYQAEVVIASDDIDRPEVRVKLTGTLRPNLAPEVCANITQVKPADGPPISYNSAAEWSSLLVPPPGGYDFTQTRDVRPKSTVTFSALSDPNDQTRCTTDPEDGRIGLTYRWEVTPPSGAPPLAFGGATNPQATLLPVFTGEYTVLLTVKDSQGHTTTTTLKFAVAIKEDLVAQLSWSGFTDVDLDVHLIRPSAVTSPADPFSGAFAFFDQGANGSTSGDINGYAVLRQKNTPGYDFDWGESGTHDDPRLNLDDTGSGELVENVSLDYPENDPACASTPCAYKVMVHYFRDLRPSSGALPCTVDGSTCQDGDACDCSTQGTRCVANEAPASSAPAGAGKCFVPPRPVVKIFLKGSSTPAAVIPLDTLSPPDELVVPAPCQMLYVADVIWPAKGSSDAPQIVVKGADGSGRITSPQIQRFGFRQADSRQCSPNDSFENWYAPAP